LNLAFAGNISAKRSRHVRLRRGDSLRAGEQEGGWRFAFSETRKGGHTVNDSLRFPESIFSEFDRLQQQLDQSLRMASAPLSIRGSVRGTFPAVNVGSTPETFEIVAFAPGIDPKSLQLSIDKGLLIIVGERKNKLPEDDERTSIYAQERFAGPFRRVVTLPEDADSSRVDAKYRDGCLRISVRKLESSKPRQIQIH